MSIFENISFMCIASEANASANLPSPGKVVPLDGGMRPQTAIQRVQAWEDVGLFVTSKGKDHAEDQQT